MSHDLPGAHAPVPTPRPAAPSVPIHDPFAGAPGYGTPLGATPTKPRRTVRRRTAWWMTTGAGVLGLVVGLSAGGGDTTPDLAATPDVTSASKNAEAAENDVAADKAPVDEAAADEAPAAAAEGTRDNPYPVGTEVKNEDWNVTLGKPHEAWAEIKAENEFNEPPADGLEFWIVPVTATYTGEESGTAWVDLTVQFVGTDAVTYSDSCGVIPDDLMDVGELYAGGVAEGNACVAVPAGTDGLWTVGDGWSDPTFFSAE